MLVLRLRLGIQLPNLSLLAFLALLALGLPPNIFKLDRMGIRHDIVNS